MDSATPLRGTVQKPLTEGYHMVSPLARIYHVDLREQAQEDSLDVLANNGLDIKLTSSILYQPIGPEAYQLIKETGPDYYTALVSPYLRSSARKVVGRYSPEEIYSSKREQIEREIREEVAQKLAGKHVIVNAVLIREVHLPAPVQEGARNAVRARADASGGGTQAHRSVGNRRLSVDHQQGAERSGDRMEGNRGNGKTGGISEFQGDHRRIREERPAGHSEHGGRCACAGREPVNG
jgi:regulator of protease activity HflC (stomatin/prohibitin superfamily)